MGSSRSQFGERYAQLVDKLPLSIYQKDIIRNRYITIVVDTEKDYHITSFAYYTLVSTVTVSSVIIASLLVLNKFFVDSLVLFWISWAVAIIIALSNKLLYSFSISKKYILNSILLGKLYSECWTFLTGGGKYKKYIDLDKRFEVFCERLEKIKLKSIESISEIELGDTSNTILAASPRASINPSTQPVDIAVQPNNPPSDNIV